MPGRSSGYNNTMLRFRHGLVIGLAVGYYLGTKAGRERYQEIEHWLDKVRGTSPYRGARSTLTDLYDEGRLRTKSLLDDATGGAVDRILDARPTDDDQEVDPTLN